MSDHVYCPACDSLDTIPYPFGESATSYVYKTLYPHARKCVDCEYVWLKPASKLPLLSEIKADKR